MTLWIVAPPGSRILGFSRQEYWNGLPCPPPGDLPSPGIKPTSPTLQVDSSRTEPPGKPLFSVCHILRACRKCRRLGPPQTNHQSLHFSEVPRGFLCAHWGGCPLPPLPRVSSSADLGPSWGFASLTSSQELLGLRRWGEGVREGAHFENPGPSNLLLKGKWAGSLQNHLGA